MNEIPKGLNVNNHRCNLWTRNDQAVRTLEEFNYNRLVDVEPFLGSVLGCYLIPQVAPVVIHIQPLRGFMQFFSSPYLKDQIFVAEFFTSE